MGLSKDILSHASSVAENQSIKKMYMLLKEAESIMSRQFSVGDDGTDNSNDPVLKGEAVAIMTHIQYFLHKMMVPEVSLVKESQEATIIQLSQFIKSEVSAKKTKVKLENNGYAGNIISLFVS